MLQEFTGVRRLLKSSSVQFLTKTDVERALLHTLSNPAFLVKIYTHISATPTVFDFKTRIAAIAYRMERAARSQLWPNLDRCGWIEWGSAPLPKYHHYASGKSRVWECKMKNLASYYRREAVIAIASIDPGSKLQMFVLRKRPLLKGALRALDMPNG